MRSKAEKKYAELFWKLVFARWTFRKTPTRENALAVRRARDNARRFLIRNA